MKSFHKSSRVLGFVLAALLFGAANAQSVSVSVSWNDIIGRSSHSSNATIVETTPSRSYNYYPHYYYDYRPSVRVYNVPVPSHRPSVRVYTVPTHRPGVRVYTVPTRSYSPSRSGVINFNINTGRWHY